jgi:hypothetical protein
VPVGTVMSRLYRGRRLMEASMLEFAREHGYLREREPLKMRSRASAGPAGSTGSPGSAGSTGAK